MAYDKTLADDKTKTGKADAKQAVPVSRPKSMAERIAMLGIPEEERTQAVTLAVSALLEKLDDNNAELAAMRDHVAEMQQLVDVDCLAPIPNRRAFIRRLKWAVSMCKRYNHPSSILYFDLNDFKEINDKYGHAAGDQAIRHVSEILTSMLRDSDFVGRIGGDEFAIIMYHAGEKDAKRRCKVIAEKIRSREFVFNGVTIPLSTAYGCYTVKQDDDAESALSNADIAMYVDKKKYHRKSPSGTGVAV